jgi:hypothetical protein
MANGNIGCGDSAVSWTTSDDDNSYLPALHCGAFDVVVARGVDWGAPHALAGVLFVVGYGDEGSDELASVDFDWHQIGFERALASILGASLEHPVPGNVLEAGRDLWTALMFDSSRAS